MGRVIPRLRSLSCLSGRAATALVALAACTNGDVDDGRNDAGICELVPMCEASVVASLDQLRDASRVVVRERREGELHVVFPLPPGTTTAAPPFRGIVHSVSATTIVVNGASDEGTVVALRGYDDGSLREFVFALPTSDFVRVPVGDTLSVVTEVDPAAGFSMFALMYGRPLIAAVYEDRPAVDPPTSSLAYLHVLRDPTPLCITTAVDDRGCSKAHASDALLVDRGIERVRIMPGSSANLRYVEHELRVRFEGGHHRVFGECGDDSCFTPTPQPLAYTIARVADVYCDPSFVGTCGTLVPGAEPLLDAIVSDAGVLRLFELGTIRGVWSATADGDETVLTITGAEETLRLRARVAAEELAAISDGEAVQVTGGFDSVAVRRESDGALLAFFGHAYSSPDEPFALPPELPLVWRGGDFYNCPIRTTFRGHCDKTFRERFLVVEGTAAPLAAGDETVVQVGSSMYRLLVRGLRSRTYESGCECGDAMADDLSFDLVLQR